MTTSETPYEANPQLAEIKRLESLCTQKDQSIAARHSEIRELQATIHSLKTELENPFAKTWEIVLLKRLLRVCAVLIWFSLVIGCLAGAPYMHIAMHKQPEVYYLLFPGLLLGTAFWFYIHEKET